ncbi:hypothetical protein T07_5418 [Trichinella nelsoni]|uniref:Uncharacterized protein n=1 Tax=Trichinella nelsoni TaxID=6336 RepID=A0A0V0SE53_9BILA|nr:hypothetical protein T07_5418 [Trichinella nelsoni]
MVQLRIMLSALRGYQGNKCDKCALVDEYECDINLSQIKWCTFCTPLLFLANIFAALIRFKPDFSK